MKLEHRFALSLPPEAAWPVLLDVARIVRSMPGAELAGQEGDVWLGRVKVKVGPVVAHYDGKARFLEQDATARRAVLLAEGRDTKGQGNARATITLALAPSEVGTSVEVVTDLAITGRLAQIGRGLLAEVSGKLLAEFATNLERDLGAEAPRAGAEVAEGEPREPRELREPVVSVEPVDLIAVAGRPALVRFLPIVIAVVLAVLTAIALF